jgi:hypothetical protein
MNPDNLEGSALTGIDALPVNLLFADSGLKSDTLDAQVFVEPGSRSA